MTLWDRYFTFLTGQKVTISVSVGIIIIKSWIMAKIDFLGKTQL